MSAAKKRSAAKKSIKRSRGRHRRHATPRSVLWLRAGAVAAGLGAAVATGYGVAAAAPDSTAPADSSPTGSASAAPSSNSAQLQPDAAKAAVKTGPHKITHAASATSTDTPRTTSRAVDDLGGATASTHGAQDNPRTSRRTNTLGGEQSIPTAATPSASATTVATSNASTSPTLSDPGTDGASTVTQSIGSSAIAAAKTVNTIDAPTPTAPSDPPNVSASLVMVRRDVSTAAPQAVSSAGPLTVHPVVALTDGVITGATGAVDANGYPLSYTLAGAPDQGGYVLLDPATGNFEYVPDAKLVSAKGTEQFSVLVGETTPLDAGLEQLPVLGSLVPQLLAMVQQAPVLRDVLAPLIGRAVTAPINVDIGAVVPDGAPVARTITVTSFDGTQINAHFYPASGLQAGQTAPTVFNGAGLGFAGDTNPNSPWGSDPWNLFKGDAPLRADGYNVVTWDSRGEFGSGGVLNLDSTNVEGRDVSAIIDTVAAQPEATLDGPGDPRMGMIGGSYGGAIQLVTAATDHRIDAIVPAVTWHSLTNSLYQNDTFKTAYSALLLLGEVNIGAQVIPQLYEGLLTGALTGTLTPDQQQLLASRSPQVQSITAPTLLLQAAGDPLFGLSEAQANAQVLAADGVPVKMVWYCGGHGPCLNPGDAGAALVQKDTLAWLDHYVKGDQSVSTGPTFEWLDQNGQTYSSDLLSSDPAFHGAPVVVSGSGGILPIIPVVGGSGPQPLDVLPYSLTEASKATSALNLTVPAGATTTEIVGAPQLTMTYSGVGTSHAVYAQLVDNKTGLVVGDIVTPVPVTLDGQTHTVTVPLEEIAQTMAPGDTLTLQLTGSATAYENFTSVGVINVSSMQLALPTVGTAADAMTESSPPRQSLQPTQLGSL
jgi:ABC-2 type transport system ATP-binding protein